MAESRGPQSHASTEATEEGTPYQELPWAVTEAKIQEAVRRIVEVAHPSRIILFGSAARGELHRDSDADFLVVVPDEVDSTRQVAQRLHRAAASVSMPKDILVVRESVLRSLADRWDLVYPHALEEGRVLYEAEHA